MLLYVLLVLLVVVVVVTFVLLSCIVVVFMLLLILYCVHAHVVGDIDIGIVDVIVVIDVVGIADSVPFVLLVV